MRSFHPLFLFNGLMLLRRWGALLSAIAAFPLKTISDTAGVGVLGWRLFCLLLQVRRAVTDLKAAYDCTHSQLSHPHSMVA
jgi:hypothetical protein